MREKPAEPAVAADESRQSECGCGEIFTGSSRNLDLPQRGLTPIRQRIPPRSWWARKKFSEPAVAIDAEAEISSAKVAAAAICAKRYTLPPPAQPISRNHERA